MRIYSLLHIHISKPYSQATELFAVTSLHYGLISTTLKPRNAYEKIRWYFFLFNLFLNQFMMLK